MPENTLNMGFQHLSSHSSGTACYLADTFEALLHSKVLNLAFFEAVVHTQNFGEAYQHAGTT
jgi:hypothetical protein